MQVVRGVNDEGDDVRVLDDDAQPLQPASTDTRCMSRDVAGMRSRRRRRYFSTAGEQSHQSRDSRGINV